MEEKQPEYFSETKMIKNQIASVVSNWIHLLELGLQKMEGWDERYTKFLKLFDLTKSDYIILFVYV